MFPQARNVSAWYRAPRPDSLHLTKQLFHSPARFGFDNATARAHVLVMQVQVGNVASTPRMPSFNGLVPSIAGQDSQQKDIRQRRSAPEQFSNLNKELRSCKSAPDLTAPALAAIRGLQNGTLQVDRHTRMKIAAAAKRCWRLGN